MEDHDHPRRPLPFIWLPIWWFSIGDHPREAKWISHGRKGISGIELKHEVAAMEASKGLPFSRGLFASLPSSSWSAIYFLHNCAAYGCMTFFISGLKGRGFSPLQYGILVRHSLCASRLMIMIINSWHSDKTGQERRAHVAIGLSSERDQPDRQRRSYARSISGFPMRPHCFAICRTLRGDGSLLGHPAKPCLAAVLGVVVGLVNAFGNLGGFAGPYIAGWLIKKYHSIDIPFNVLGVGMLVAAGLSLSAQSGRAATGPPIVPVSATKSLP